MSKHKEDKKSKPSELAELKAKCEEYLSGWQRARADYENFKKEQETRIKQLTDYATADILDEVLEIKNHFKTALEHVPSADNNQPWFQGLELIQKQFIELFKKYNIQEIETVGKDFDPAFHEAISYEDSAEPEGRIIKEAKPGYLIGDRVLQPAQVVVSNNKSKKTDINSTADTNSAAENKEN